jgi:hypothetical protein
MLGAVLTLLGGASFIYGARTGYKNSFGSMDGFVECNFGIVTFFIGILILLMKG